MPGARGPRPDCEEHVAALIYIASEAEPDTPLKEHGSLLLDSSPEFWFLYRYFEDANLDHAHPVIDL